MRYISTRGFRPPKTFSEILLEGLAPDGGLYVPESYPQLDLKLLRGKGYRDVAKTVLHLYAPEIPYADVEQIVDETYTAETFGSNEITPVHMLTSDLGLLRLSNGPTLAFKDVALQLVARLMEYALKRTGKRLNILGATSGDTGSAAEYAIRRRLGMNVFMLSPYGRMSRFQQLQMYTLNEPNIHNLVVNGTFDDCQRLMKLVNADADFKAKFDIGAVNSINWARIAAQVVYYVYAALRAKLRGDQAITFAVPSGNFGNALAAHIASEMGLPIVVLVCTNENDVLDEFFCTGIYRVRKGNEVAKTSSPSMDIAEASNFERWMFDFVGRDHRKLNSFWSTLKNTGQFNVHDREPGSLMAIESGKAAEPEVIKTIRTVYAKWGTVIDPHTAVAMSVALRKVNYGRILVAETAQPAKFSETIREAIGQEPAIPAGYEKLASLPEYTTRIDPDPDVVKAYIAAHVH